VIGVLKVVAVFFRDDVAFLRGLGELELERHAAFLAHVRQNRIPILRGEGDAALVQHVEAVGLLRSGARRMQHDCRGQD
jgi:hypothetical protein